MTSTAIDAAHDIRDITLADEGKRRTEWAERSMPVLRQIRERFRVEQTSLGVAWRVASTSRPRRPT